MTFELFLITVSKKNIFLHYNTYKHDTPLKTIIYEKYTNDNLYIGAEDLSSLKPGKYIRGGHKYVVKKINLFDSIID